MINELNNIKYNIMKNVLRIKSSDFIDWYFNSGADQDQEEQILSLGRSVVERLLEGSVTITPQDILEECEQFVIPLNIIKGFEGTDSTMEIQDGIDYGRISKDFKIALV